MRKKVIMEKGINGRTIVIGDVHGCLEELEELLKTVQFKFGIDRLIIVGDLIDRGPDSVGVVRRCRQLDAEVTMGNHEWKFLKWWKGNKHYDAHKHYKELNDDDVAYINRMPYHLKLTDSLYVVHAGVKPGIPIEKQKRDDLLYLRYTDSDRHFISMHKVAKGQAPEAIFWTEFWKGPESIIYGHNVHGIEDPRIVEVDTGVKCYGIDTGCCFGGRLTAMIVETGEFVQVQAKKVYYKSDIFNEGS